MHLTSELVIGATVDLRDGFVGCMRGLMVNGRHLDMRAAALANLYGIGVGCTGKCDSNPCLNNGTCHEKYDQYDCDCRFTSFKGASTKETFPSITINVLGWNLSPVVFCNLS